MISPMPAPTSHFRRGMTLAELMVVVAIIGLLAVTVLPALSATAELRRGREAARMVSSFIAKAQSRAIGRREWSGFQLVATGATSYAALDLVLADVPPVYRGDTVPALLRISGTPSSSTRTVSGTSGQLLLSGSLPVLQNDLVRFNAQGPWYELSANATTGTSVNFRIRGDLEGLAKVNAKAESAGQKQHNTPWPSGNDALSFEILRQPVSVGSPVALAEGRVVDLYWSGFGPPLTVGGTATYRRFETVTTGSLTLNASAGATTSILFDGTGRARQIQVKTAASTDRLVVTGPIFLLIGRADRFMANPSDSNDRNQPGKKDAADDSTGANWQYSDSHWVAIDPLTGVAKSAECMASGTTVIESQYWIRQALLAGGN